MTETIHEGIPLNQLRRCPNNVRATKPSKAADKALRASIKAHGLQQNLVAVRNGDKYLVTAGGRRLEQLRALAKSGDIATDYLVPCQLIDESRAVAAAIAENTVRQALHPADEFEAFSRLVDAGHTPKDVAQQYGCTVKYVKQRMKLAQVAPVILEAYRKGNVTLDEVQTYTLSTDHGKQVEVFEQIQAKGYGSTWAIRRALTDEAVDATEPMAMLVGRAAYVRAGGHVNEDLFGDKTSFEDGALLLELAQNVMAKKVEEILADGWSWCESLPPNGEVWLGSIMQQVSAVRKLNGTVHEGDQEVGRRRLKELKDRVDELEGREPTHATEDALADLYAEIEGLEHDIDECRTFTQKQKAQSGVVVFVMDDGKLHTMSGLVRKADDKKTETAGTTSTSSGASSRGKDDDSVPGLKPSAKLLEDLAKHRTRVWQARLASHEFAAGQLVAFHFAMAILFREPSGFFGYGELQASANASVAPGIDECVASKDLKAKRDALDLSWYEEGDTEASARGYRALDLWKRVDIWTYCCAVLLSDWRCGGYVGQSIAPFLDSVIKPTADLWRPTEENYFGRLTKAQLLTIGTEVYGDEWHKQFKGKKKGDLTDWLSRAAADGNEAWPAEANDTMRAWVPAEMEQ